jgi:hypothetical protein
MQQLLLRVLAIAAATGLILALAVPAFAGTTRTYEVTIHLVAQGQGDDDDDDDDDDDVQARGQPLTPPLIATHKDGTGIFEVGKPASFGVKEIAENGNLDPLIEALEADPKVSHVVAAGAPLVPVGSPMFGTFDDEVTLTIEAGRGARFLSFESMLICTNDGFTGINRLRLPDGVGQTVRVVTASYDAGTEINTEDFADLVPPCQGLMGVSSGESGTGTSDPDLAEGGVIHHHPGIEGGADLLPEVHGWTDPITLVTITRVD